MNTFSDRINAVLTYDGFITEEAKGRRIAATFGVHKKTAARWLAGLAKPRGLSAKYCDGLDALNMPYEWIFLGIWEWRDDSTERQAKIAGKDHRMIRVLANFRSMTEWEKGKFMRLLLRLRNDDSKAIRLLDMKANGLISRQQMLESV